MTRAAARHLRLMLRHGGGYWRESVALTPGRRSAAGRVRDILSGYHPNEADWYRQIHGTSAGFVTNLEREGALKGLNGSESYVIDNKLVLMQVLRAEGLPMPALFGHRMAGGWVWRAGGHDSVARILRDGGRVVVKPIRGRKGGGVRVCRSWDEVDAPAERAVIASAFVEQADYAARIFPDALNTIRVLMLRDRAGRIVLGAATHRFGRAASAPVDNFSAGGVVAKVRVADGTLDRAVSIAPDNRVLFSDAHPETDAAIAGVRVAHWDAVRDLVQRLGEVVPLLRYVGWDIAVTEAGPVVIEGNSHPSLRFFQFYDRVAEAPENRPFFAEFLPRLAR